MNNKSEKKRLMAKQRRDRIKNDPVLYERAKERERERYSRRKREKKLLPIGELSPKLQKEIRKRNRANFRAYYRRKKEAVRTNNVIESEPEVTLIINKEMDGIDPLDASAATPGHSRYGLRSSCDNTSISDRSLDLSSTIVQKPPLVQESIASETLLQQSSSNPFNLIPDVKNETNSAGQSSPLSIQSINPQFFAKLETCEDQSDYEDQYSIADNDLSRENTGFVRTTTKDAEVHSDSTVYSDVLANVKPKRKVTAELKLQRYKLKAKREIDRLHNRIRELKTLVDKYKRRVYRLRKKCP